MKKMNVDQWNQLGFITGVDRSEYADTRKSHLYLAARDQSGQPLIMDPITPMCKRGWNRDDGEAFSIFRNNVSKRGICTVCARIALKFVAKYPIGTDYPAEYKQIEHETM